MILKDYYKQNRCSSAKVNSTAFNHFPQFTYQIINYNKNYMWLIFPQTKTAQEHGNKTKTLKS